MKKISFSLHERRFVSIIITLIDLNYDKKVHSVILVLSEHGIKMIMNVKCCPFLHNTAESLI